MTANKVRIVYDKKCPACSLYCELYQAAAHTEQQPQTRDVSLLDARADSDLMTRITQLGLDIDEGMVVEMDNELHYGADAIHALARSTNQHGWFNRANRLLFKNRRVARVLYPVLRAVRNFLLKVLGVKRINNLDLSGREKF